MISHRQMSTPKITSLTQHKKLTPNSDTSRVRVDIGSRFLIGRMAVQSGSGHRRVQISGSAFEQLRRATQMGHAGLANARRTVRMYTYLAVVGFMASVSMTNRRLLFYCSKQGKTSASGCSLRVVME